MTRKKLLSKKWSRRQFLKSTVAAGLLGTTLSARNAIKGFAQSDMPTALLDAVAQESGTLNVFNWSFYIADNTVPDFEAEFGIEVVYDLYESNDEMLARVQAAPGQFDIAVPTQDTLIEMRELGLLESLNHDWLPNLSNLSPEFISPIYDPGNQFSMAYQWGTTGYGLNENFAGEDARRQSWEILFRGQEYSGKMSMLDESDETIAEALKFAGFSMNDGSPEALEAARQLLLAQKPLLQAYISGPVRDLLGSEDVWIANLWSGDVLFVQGELNENVSYVLPSEGAELWTDNMVIPKSAPHPATAHLWLNYIQRAQVQADITNYVFYATPNQAAIDQGLLDPDLLGDANIFPSDEVRARLEILAPQTGQAREIRDTIWEELKS